jgi:arylsulfatase A-like enzyme
MKIIFPKLKKVVLIFLVCLCHTIVAQPPPNFVIVVLDDQGWTGTSVKMDALIADSKSDFHITAALESLALEGMTFAQGYAPAPKCSPSRASILTGKSPARNNFTNTDNSIATNKILIEPTIQTSLDGNEITYAEWLKSAGLNYRTAHFGKWHQGSSTASSPSENGFDFSDGSTNNADGNQGGTVQTDPKKIVTLTNKSIQFINEAVTDGVPFALQLSHYAVHSDIEAKQATINLYNDASQRPLGTRHTNVEYAAMTEDTDDGISLLLNEITSLGLDDSTYVIFVSDNGGQLNLTDNSPLSFGKTFIKEGGIRVPFIVKGPDISQNSRNTEAVVGYDLFPTIAELSGSSTSLPVNIDGQSIVPLLIGNSFIREKPIYFHSPHYENNPNKKPRSALVDRNNKLIVNYETGTFELFDLSVDIGESIDLSNSQAVYTRELTIQLRNYLKEVSASMPTLDPTHVNFSGTGVDVDSDGLDDSWEFKELLSYTFGANDDPDNDGKTNLEEYTNGTDPYVDEEALNNLDFNYLRSPISIYPNPARKSIKLSVKNNLNTSDISDIRIYDTSSKLVYYSKGFVEDIRVSSLEKGVYIVKIMANTFQVIKKIVIE